MDLITQGLAGALLAQGVARRPELRRAALVGALAGLLPDADILIRSAADPLYSIEFHRHFTHSLAFAPFGALLLTLILWPCLVGGLSFFRTWMFALLGIVSGGLLDACTSFGTHLLWPFSDERIALNLVAIIDPVFTLILLLALWLALRRLRRGAAHIGIVLALAYLSLAFVQHQRAEAVAVELAHARGHSIERMEVKPTLGNIVLWRSVYESEAVFHVDAVRVGWLGATRVYEGDSLARLATDRVSEAPPGSVLENDIARFAKLADDYLVRHPARSDVLGDIRYAMLPNSVAPLWGIRIDPTQPDRHVEFVTLREFGSAVRGRFLSMLRGVATEVDASGSGVRIPGAG